MTVARYWDVAAGLLIVLGLMQVPGDRLLPGLPAAGTGLGRLGGLLAMVDLVPALPLLLALAALAGARLTFGAARGLILASALPAAVLTLGASYDSGGGGTIILIEGAALTLGCWGMLLRLAGSVTGARVALGLALLVALWSLATPVAVAARVRGIAGQDAYCIARHEADRPIRSWAELRGVSFHTDRSGYKDTSDWYLHGVLLVQRAGGIEVWNWSPRRMRFDRLDRASDLMVSPFGSCTPKLGFLNGLALL